MSTKDTDPPLTTETVEHVADLARITLSKKEASDAIQDLSSILGHIDLIRSVDTSGVEPLDHPTELVDRSREDEVSDPLSQQQVFSNAPAVRDVYLDVPKVLGGDS
jgi:aspartyl-tRNA(Asn)/glutamyl-tRNA(Gln) amidotransferase subunit C